MVLLVLGGGCTIERNNKAGGPAATSSDPKTRELHAKLFNAADAGDVEAFKAVLTSSSIALFETHFQVMDNLPQPTGAAPMTWRDVLAMHASLDATARKRTPYPAVLDDGHLRLDVASHPDARFFEAVATGLSP